MNQDIQTRKTEHVEIARHSKDADRRKYYFDKIRLSHRALPEINLQDVDPTTTFLDHNISFPLLISSMTGGAGEELLAINRNLALSANAVGIPLAVGSMRIMLEYPETKKAFCLRKYAPNIPICGNLGAIQLNHGVSTSEIKRLCEETEIDALFLHLNPLQEAMQKEGQTDFRGLGKKIRNVVAALPIPVIAKEVGAGISPKDTQLLIEAGISHIEIAGSGGTSWSRIEYERDPTSDKPGACFEDWGIPTPDAIRLLHPFREKITLIASGGIRTGIDMAKALVLGASLCGIARPLLEPACHAPEAVIKHLENMKKEFCVSMFLLGMPTLETVIGNDKLILDLNNPARKDD